ncbi:MAG: CHASE4 domain-containing protein [Anaerolineales bacterium]
MSLRKKSLLIIVLTTILLLTLLYFAVHAILLHSFTELEASEVERNVARARSALFNEISALDAVLFDWAAWNDTYAFVDDLNQDYVESNLLDEAFTPLQLNLMVFLNSEGEIVFKKAFDLELEREVQDPLALRLHLEPDSPLLQHESPESTLSGLLALPRSPMLLASRPIVTSDNQGPINGTLIMGRYLDQEKVAGLSDQIHLPLAFFTLDELRVRPELQQVAHTLQESAGSLVVPRSSTEVAGYTLIPDIYGNPLLLVEVQTSRDIYRQGRQTLSYVLISIALSGLIFGAVSIFLLENNILTRITGLSRSVSEIATRGDLSERVTDQGGDELGRLTDDINEMLAALQESNRRFETLFHSAADAIAVFDLEGHFLEINEIACQRLGYTREELLRMTPADLDTPQHASRVPQRIEEILNAGTYFFEAEQRRKDGTIMPVEILGQLIEYEGRPAILSITRDITERKRLEEQLRQQDRMAAIGQLAGGIAHDFNNILTTITLYTQLVLEDSSTEPQMEQKLNVVLGESHRAAKLVRQILDFSRSAPMEARPVDLNAFVMEVADILKRTLPANVHFLVEMEPNSHTVHADPTRIQQVLLNLVMNARDAMPYGGELRIRLSKLEVREGEEPPVEEMSVGNWICLAVKDTGNGMPPAVLSHLFEPFFTTKGPNGNGLGLAQVHGIVKQHEGFIDLETREKRGTTFYIYLPEYQGGLDAAEADERQAPVEEEATSQGWKGCHGTIMLVEDEEQVRNLTQQILMRAGYNVVTAENGRAALILYRTVRDIDLVITDLVMPDLGGEALLRHLREEDPEIKALILTGYAVREEIESLLARDQVRLLYKPFPKEALVRLVREMLRSQHAEVCV